MHPLTGFFDYLKRKDFSIDTWNSETSWSTPYVRVKAPVPVRKGDLVEMVFQSDVAGNPRYFLKLARMMNGAAKEIGQHNWTGD